jgi:hypothetical protein
MNRALDQSPGNIVIWIGLSMIVDIILSFNMAMKMTCG